MSGNNSYLIIGGILILVLFASGILVWNGEALFFGDTLIYGLDTGDTSTSTTTTTTTVTEPDGGEDTFNGDASSLSLSTGYVDEDGNAITQSGIAQSVFWAGSDREVADVFLEPVLTVSHSDAVIGLDEVSYHFGVPKITALFRGADATSPSIEGEMLYADYLTISVFDLPADGGSLGQTMILRDMFDIEVDPNLGSEQFEQFLWGVLSDMNVELGFEILGSGSFVVSVDIHVVITDIEIFYSYIADDGMESIGIYSTSAMFPATIPLELHFVIDPVTTPVEEITWLGVDTVPSPRNELTVGWHEIAITYKPVVENGVPSMWRLYIDGVEDSSDLWFGDYVSIIKNVYFASESMHSFRLTVYTTSGVFSSYTVKYYGAGFSSQVDGGAVDYVFSVYAPSGGDSSYGAILIGAGVLGFVGLVYYARNVEFTSMKHGKKRKR